MATLHDSTGKGTGGEAAGEVQGQQSAGAHWFLCVVICFGLRRGDLNGGCNSQVATRSAHALQIC